MLSIIQDPEQVYSFGFICGCVFAAVVIKAYQIGKRMDERNRQ